VRHVGVTVQERPAATAAPERGWRADLAAAWPAFLISRLVVWIAGLGAIGIWGMQTEHRLAFDPAGLTRPFGAVGDLVVAPAARWDSVWYLAIAGSGYDHGPDRAAFFPLYPGLIKVGAWLCGSPLVAGIVISCVCFLVALALLHRLAAIELGADAARWAVLALALFPGALWFSAVYSESLFLMVSVGCVLAARTGHWARAGALGLLAAATRSAGLLLVLPLALLWLDARRGRAPGGGGQPVRARDLAWLALVPAGLGAYCGYLALAGLPADAPFSAQDTWHRALAGPWAGVRDGAVAAWDGLRQILHGEPPPVYFTKAAGDAVQIGRHNLMLFGFLVLAVPVLVGAVRRLPLAHGAYAVAALLLPLSYPVGPQPLMSLPRFEAVLYPLFLWLGWWLARGSVVRRAVVLGACAAALTVFSALFATWHWVA
jgi:Mannosyltransferase (PIG-V)